LTFAYFIYHIHPKLDDLRELLLEPELDDLLPDDDLRELLLELEPDDDLLPDDDLRELLLDPELDDLLPDDDLRELLLEPELDDLLPDDDLPLEPEPAEYCTPGFEVTLTANLIVLPLSWRGSARALR